MIVKKHHSDNFHFVSFMFFYSFGMLLNLVDGF